MEPLVSVVIPVYKTEKYVVKSVNSILTQSYKNTEIILSSMTVRLTAALRYVMIFKKAIIELLLYIKKTVVFLRQEIRESMRQTVNMFSFWIRTTPFTPML